MKIIFSRKGFDSTAGGFASPIFPNGTLFSVPIPSSEDNTYYSHLDFQYDGESIQSILNDLTNKKINYKNHCDYSIQTQLCHHDPMRSGDKKYFALGQSGRAAGHLEKNRVGPGDLFVFYGWFRKVEKHNGLWRYDPDARDIHLIWAGMFVDHVRDVCNAENRKSVINNFGNLVNHPHLNGGYANKDYIFISEKYELYNYSDARCLTDMKYYTGRSKWRLPNAYNHQDAFTYLKKFSPYDDDVVITFRGYGQEFILDLDRVPKNDKEIIINHIRHVTNGLI